MKKLIVFAGSLFFFSLFPPPPANAKIERKDIQKNAEIVSVEGESWMRFFSGNDWLTAQREQALAGGDFIKTGNFGRMGVLFTDGIQIKVNRNTLLAIKAGEAAAEKKPGPLTLLLNQGEIWSRSKTIPDGLKIETPSSTAAVRGTDWDMLVDEQGRSYLTVIRGQVQLSNDFGSITVAKGEQAMAEKGQPPRKTMLFTPKERVQWTYSADIDLMRFAVFYSLRRGQAAEKMLKTEAELSADTGNPAARLTKAGLLFDLGRNDESLGLLDQILEKDPANPTALVYKGLALLRKGEKPAEPAALFDNALKYGAGVEALIGKAEICLRKGDWAGMFALLSAAEKQNPKEIVGLAQAAALAFTGCHADAEKICRDYQARYPGDERFPVLLASIYMAMDEMEKADREVRRGLALNPEYGPGLHVLAGLHYLNGNAEEAEAVNQKALTLDPLDARAKTHLGVILTETGRYEEAGPILTEALALNPHNPLTNSELGLLHLLTEKTQAAQADFDTAFQNDPTYHQALNGKALALLREGQTAGAIQLLLRSSLIQPKSSATHSLLAVAYHQQGDFEKALAETALAMELDPLDRLPYFIANLIYQDTYRPFEAVAASRKALELLPFQKGLNVIEDTKAGTANVGSALLGLGLGEWADSFAQEGYDTFRPSSHFQSARRYHDNHYVNAGEMLQGLMIEPLANYTPAGYQDIIRRPRHDATLSLSAGDTEGGFSRAVDGSVQGYLRDPVEIAYSLAGRADKLDGEKEKNNFSRAESLAAGIGIKTDYQNAFNIGLTMAKQNTGHPGSRITPDPDDRDEYSDYSADLGYTHRFGARNRLLCRLAYNENSIAQKNPYPFGTGLGGPETSFIVAGYTLAETQRFFRQGVYDISAVMGGSALSLATDSTGTLAAAPVARLRSYAFPPVFDEDPQRLDRYETASSAFQTRHMLALGKSHEVSWGLEYLPFRVTHTLTYNALDRQGEILFYDEPFLYPDETAWRFPLLAPREAVTKTLEDSHVKLIYAADRWSPRDWLLVEAGLFGEQFDDTYNDDKGLYPRAGLALKIAENHVLRCAYQKWLEKPVIGTLSPLATAGLVPDNSLGLLGSRLDDLQARLESRWGTRFFTVISAERVDLTDPKFEDELFKRELYLHKAGLAVNALLADQLGAYARYAYAQGKFKSGVLREIPVQYVPDHQATAGLVWVSPLYFKVVLSESFIGRQYAYYSKEIRLEEYFSTDLALTFEPFGKKARFTLSVSNLANAGRPAADRSIFCGAGIRF